MGPLSGIKIIELAGIGPGPFCGMLLADMGAEVIRVERTQAVAAAASGRAVGIDLLTRGRRSIGVDLKHPDGIETVLALVAGADGLIEGFRPGVTERLGVGPDACLSRNPALVYGRMTGWGQDGPYAHMAGHDINYIALSGALAHIGRKGEAPVPPLNLVGDFGGGGMVLAFGMVCGVLSARSTGSGQIVDASMVDGAALLTTFFHSLIANGGFRDERGTNLLDTGSHFYDAYECADGEYVSIGSIEPQFYAELCQRIGLTPGERHHFDPAEWAARKPEVAAIFATKTRAQWCELLEGTDVCFAPVLSMREAPQHPHNMARQTFVQVNGVTQPAPAPRFSVTTVQAGPTPTAPGVDTDSVLAEFGFDAARIAALRASGAVA
jgi:alpha-methylacyl-CoA racemase